MDLDSICKETEHDRAEDDGDEAAVSPSKARQQNNELSPMISRHPELALNSKVVGAIDAGVRNPISVAVARPQSNPRINMRMKKCSNWRR